MKTHFKAIVVKHSFFLPFPSTFGYLPIPVLSPAWLSPNPHPPASFSPITRQLPSRQCEGKHVLHSMTREVVTFQTAEHSASHGSMTHSQESYLLPHTWVHTCPRLANVPATDSGEYVFWKGTMREVMEESAPFNLHLAAFLLHCSCICTLLRSVKAENLRRS